MKAIIYAGIGLFSAASIYGVADYYQSEEKGVLKNLYKDVPAIKETKAAETPAERDIKMEDYSRAKIEEPVELKQNATAINNLRAVKKMNEPVFKMTVSKRKLRKIKLSDFSRSALIVRDTDMVVTDSSIEKY